MLFLTRPFQIFVSFFRYIPEFPSGIEEATENEMIKPGLNLKPAVGKQWKLNTNYNQPNLHSLTL